jgi:hypothetical protein
MAAILGLLAILFSTVAAVFWFNSRKNNNHLDK